MTDERSPGRPGLAEEGELGRLLESAGPRPEVPPEELAAITAAFRDAWQRRYGRRRPPALSWALAASVALAALAALWWWQGGADTTVARVERVAGRVTLAPAAGEALPRDLAAGLELRAGAELTTAGDGDRAASVALRLADGAGLRIAAGSRLRLTTAGIVELERGAVYFDSAAGPGGIEVHTPLGVARDVGTRFEVRLAEGPEQLEVRVRDGAVAVEAGGESLAVAAGAGLVVAADGGLRRFAVEPAAPAWRWAEEAAPRPSIEGRPVSDFLAWVARETSLELRYASPATARRAAATVLHGELGDLPPRRALEVVLPSAGLGHRVEGGVLLVAER